MMSPRRVSFTPTRSAGCARSRTRRGFSFTEVLFAVMILGVGFIMVAAIFPVAIQQARTTSEEGNAAAIARGAITFLEQNLTNADLPAVRPPGSAVGSPMPVQSFRDPQTVGTGRGGVVNLNDNQPPRAGWFQNHQLWNKVRGNLISADDPRYAWVPLYRREMVLTSAGVETPSTYAQVFIIVTQVRNETSLRGGTAYNATDVHTPSNAAAAMVNLQARPVQVSISGATQRATFETGREWNHLAVAEGCYVIVARDNITGANAGRMNGRIYRIGNRFNNSPTEWELMPGNDFVTDAGADGVLRNPPSGDDIVGLNRADAFIVGKTITGGAPGRATFQGTAQDVAVYTTFIQVR